MTTLIKNAVVLTPDIELEEGLFIKIDDDVITYVGEELTDCKADEIIDAGGDILMPGLVNAHNHLPMALLRGVGEDLPLMEWLTKKIFPIEAKLTDEDIYYGTMAALIDHIKGGQTSFVDMYYGIDAIAGAVADAGVRALLSRCVAGCTLKETEKAIAQAEKFVTEYKDHSLIEPYYTLHAEYTCGDEVVSVVAKLAERDRVPIGVHVSETRGEHEECKMRHSGKTPTEYLNSLGVFNGKAVAAHCVWVEDKDIEILREKGVTVATCPTSNLKLGSGVAPVAKFLERGVNVAIGTDGASSADLDMISELRLCALLQKGILQNAEIMPKQTPIKMATQNGAQLFASPIGAVAEGYKADLILINTKNERFTPRSGLLSHLVYSSLGRDVRMTMVNGRVLYMDGMLRYADEAEIMAGFESVIKKIYLT